ncbi:hypothetical protein [Streptomyces sp. KR55]|uniref:hypothetical protein n=1 Tax=Streptomyces sp. KR55 TaxID=3457425 RepID=UPI003FD2767E
MPAAAVPQTLRFLTGLLSAHLKKIRSRWRKRPAGRIAVIVLAALRHDRRLADLAGGNDLSRTPVDRWLKEMIELLAAKAGPRGESRSPGLIMKRVVDAERARRP